LSKTTKGILVANVVCNYNLVVGTSKKKCFSLSDFLQMIEATLLVTPQCCGWDNSCFAFIPNLPN